MPADAVYVQLLDELLDLHYTKSGGYGTSSDPLANFTAIADATGEPAWRYPRRRALEKLTRIDSLEAQGRVDELEEEHLDVASLMLCAEVLRRRRAVLVDRPSTTCPAEEPPQADVPASGAGVAAQRPSSADLVGSTTLLAQLIERCVLCDRELEPDDHKTSAYRDGYAHDECVVFYAEAAFVRLYLIDNAEPRSPSPHPVAPVGTRPQSRTPEGVAEGFTSDHPGSGLSDADPTTDRARALFSEYLRELAETVDAELELSEQADDPEVPLQHRAARDLRDALNVASDLIGPEALAKGPYVAPCAQPAERSEEARL